MATWGLIQFATRARGAVAWNIESGKNTVISRADWRVFRRLARESANYQEIGFVRGERIYSITARDYVPLISGAQLY